jgi:hypothetical protein
MHAFKSWVLFVPLTTLFAACQSPPRSTEQVDTAWLRHVDEATRQEVAAARRVRDEAGDAIAAARIDVERARAEVEIARQERDVAVARQQQAETERVTVVRAADGSDPIVVDARVAPDVQEARLGISAADDRILWRKCSVEAEERHVALLEARKALAEAKVQQAKCAGLMRAARPEVDTLTMEGVDRTVRGCETEIAVAETRLTAAKKEVAFAKSRSEATIECRRQEVKAAEERAAAAREAEVARKATEAGRLPPS